MKSLVYYDSSGESEQEGETTTVCNPSAKVGVINEIKRHRYNSERDNSAIIKDTTSSLVLADHDGPPNTSDLDYFGITNKSSDESDSDSDGTPALKIKKRKSVLSQQYNSACGTSTQTTVAQFPESEFWRKNHETTDWTRPDLIWKKQPTTNFKSSPVCIPDSSNERHIPAKPEKQKSETFSGHNQSGLELKQLKKACFYVHHKISPYLTQSVYNSIPRKKVYDLDGHYGTVNRIHWCPHSYSHLLLSASMDSSVKIWNPFSTCTSFVQILSFHTKAVKDAKWTSNGRQIISCSYDKTARLLDVEKGSEVRCFEHESYVSCVKQHPVNFNYFITGSNNVIKCWDQRNGTKCVRIFKYRIPFGQVQDLEFLPDGASFVSCNDLVSRDSADHNIMAWDFTSGIVLSNQIYQERFTCTRLCVHPHEAQFIAQTQGDYIALFCTIKPYKMDKSKRFEGHKVLGYNIGCAFSPDGHYVLSGSSDGQMAVYDYQTGKCVHRVNTGSDVCSDVAWHPVLPSTVAMATWGGKLSVWV